MAKNLILETLLENYNVGVAEVAERIEESEEEIQLILDGKKPMTIPVAEKLGVYFTLRPELFFKEQAETSHLNIGHAANSNSGYINTYSNDQNKYAIELLSKLNSELKDQLAELTTKKQKRGWKLFN